MLRPVVSAIGARADGGVSLHRRQDLGSSGEELFDSGGQRRNLLFRVCANGVVFVDYRERAAAGDTCQFRSSELCSGILSQQVLGLGIYQFSLIVINVLKKKIT